jgi:hypothetical protein
MLKPVDTFLATSATTVPRGLDSTSWTTDSLSICRSRPPELDQIEVKLVTTGHLGRRSLRQQPTPDADVRHVGFVRLRVRLRVGLGVRLRELLLRDGYVELLLAREEDPSRPLGLQQRGAEILGLALDLDARGLAASSKTR